MRSWTSNHVCQLLMSSEIRKSDGPEAFVWFDEQSNSTRDLIQKLVPPNPIPEDLFGDPNFDYILGPRPPQPLGLLGARRDDPLPRRRRRRRRQRQRLDGSLLLYRPGEAHGGAAVATQDQPAGPSRPRAFWLPLDHGCLLVCCSRVIALHRSLGVLIARVVLRNGVVFERGRRVWGVLGLLFGVVFLRETPIADSLWLRYVWVQIATIPLKIKKIIIIIEMIKINQIIYICLCLVTCVGIWIGKLCIGRAHRRSHSRHTCNTHAMILFVLCFVSCCWLVFGLSFHIYPPKEKKLK